MNEHVRAAELLPWLVNQRIEAGERAWLLAHLEKCERCSAALRAEQRICAAVNTQSTVEYAPQASFSRLWARIEADSSTEASAQYLPGRVAARPALRQVYGRAAAVLCVTAALGAVLWQLRGPTTAPGIYRTVTSVGHPAPVNSINVIFSDAATIADMRTILGSAGLSVISGPSSAGVVTVGPGNTPDAFNLNASLATLRADPRVRFAEPAVSSR
jgi:hypothetical protein